MAGGMKRKSPNVACCWVVEIELIKRPTQIIAVRQSAVESIKSQSGPSKGVPNFLSDKSKDNEIDEGKKKPYIKYTTWVFDPCINISKKDYTSTENPVENKFSILARSNDDDLIARDIRLNPYNRAQINEVLNMPDFIELESKNTTLFWSHRYELLKKKYTICINQNYEFS